MDEVDLFNSIKTTFENDEVIKNILEVYCKGEAGTKRDIKSGRELYSVMIQDNKDNKNYEEEFKKYILLPSMNKLYENMKLVYGNGYDKDVERKIEEIKKSTMSEEDKNKFIANLCKASMYPLSKYEAIFNNFDNYGEIEKMYEERNLSSIESKLKLIESPNAETYYPESVAEFKEKLDEIPKEELETYKAIINMRKTMKNNFFGGKRIMGFHVNPQKFSLYNTGKKTQNGETKFYINAGTDTFKFASLFQEECEKQNANYYYKVVGKNTNEFKRNDKMCIYSRQESAEDMLKILQKVIEEHPEINYENPPLMTGRIDDYIGFGSDELLKGEGSYNSKMCKIIYDAIEENFKGIQKSDIMSLVEEHPEKLQQLKETVKGKIEENSSLEFDQKKEEPKKEESKKEEPKKEKPKKEEPKKEEQKKEGPKTEDKICGFTYSELEEVSRRNTLKYDNLLKSIRRKPEKAKTEVVDTPKEPEQKEQKDPKDLLFEYLIRDSAELNTESLSEGLEMFESSKDLKAYNRKFAIKEFGEEIQKAKEDKSYEKYVKEIRETDGLTEEERKEKAELGKSIQENFESAKAYLEAVKETEESGNVDTRIGENKFKFEELRSNLKRYHEITLKECKIIAKDKFENKINDIEESKDVEGR